MIPARHLIEFGTCMLVKGEDSTLFFTGTCSAPRRQIFSGFAAGEITGTFGSGQVFPEWWGLQDGEHDIAIKCAIRSNTLLASNFGIRVSLAAGRYEVSAPLDLASTASTLEGAGGNLTSVVSTAKWDATWIKAEQWGAADDPPNHAAMIWIGANIGRAYSYRTKVKGMDMVPVYFSQWTNNCKISTTTVDMRLPI